MGNEVEYLPYPTSSPSESEIGETTTKSKFSQLFTQLIGTTPTRNEYESVNGLEGNQPIKQQQNGHSKHFLILNGLLGVLLLGLIWIKITTPVLPAISLVTVKPNLLCDPFSHPGYLSTETDPRKRQWIPFDKTCSPAPDYISMIENRDKDGLAFLQNRTILLLGDSVDRNSLQHMAVMLGLPRYPVPYDDFSRKGQVPEGWDERGIPWIVEVPFLDLTFTNGFFYGLDDTEAFSTSNDWHAPGLVETRIDTLFKVHTNQLKYPPSFISIHSGLWDLALFGRKDKAADRSTASPLDNDQMNWWLNRMSNVLDHVKQTWGSIEKPIPIWFRKLHRVGEGTASTNDYRDWHKEGKLEPEKSFDFFTNLRVSQMREMQEQASIDAKIPSFDFGHIWEGLQQYQDKVHPLIQPGGPIVIQALLHHIWMESQGRDNWELSL